MHPQIRASAVLLAALFALACGVTPTSAAPTSGATVGAAVPPGAVDKVLVFVEENHSFDQMRAGMPFLYAQAQQYGYAASYAALSHPSLPNYLAIAFGSAFGVTDDASPSRHPVPEPDVFTAALKAGRTARSYQESMKGNCARTSQGSYAVRHNPWAYASDPAARTACDAGDVPAGSITAGRLHDDIVSGDLPNVGEVTPNLANDGHDGSLSKADMWLKAWLTLIYAGPDWKSGHLAIIITADEDAYNEGNHVLTTVIHPSQAAHAVATPLMHYSLTQLLSEVGHSPCIGNGCVASSFAAAFGLAIA